VVMSGTREVDAPLGPAKERVREKRVDGIHDGHPLDGHPHLRDSRSAQSRVAAEQTFGSRKRPLKLGCHGRLTRCSPHGHGWATRHRG